MTDREPVVLWEPTQERRERAHLNGFMDAASIRTGRDFPDYESLRAWSVDSLEDFWALTWEHFRVMADGSPNPVLADAAMPGATWFPSTRLNYAEHVFRGKDPEATAILHSSELRGLSDVTWAQLQADVAAAAAGLQKLGVTEGDRVVLYAPNIAEAVVAFLACAAIGAVWSSCSPDFGARSVIDRFAQIEPKVLIAVDGYRYGGKDFDRKDVVAELEAAMPTLEHTVTITYLRPAGASGRGAPPWRPGTGAIQAPDGPLTWDALLTSGAGIPLKFNRVPFSHPLWVLYSSGTTGLPKAIVQGQGGILLEQLKKGFLHLDLHAGDRMFWFTTTGWMMWNFLVGCLLTEASIVLFDGNPGHPDMGTVWDLAERTQMTCLGTSAGFLTACMKDGVEPAAGRDLSALRAIGSTGSPLPPEGFDWVYDKVKRDLWLFSTSGGTDVCTAFVGGCPLLPVFEGEIQCRALGAAVESWDENGNPVTGQVGELVITKPMPSMPLHLVNDPDGERYRESYFEMFPGVWRHGDWIELTERGTAIIYGRSDSTINRQGVRMGTSEIYRAAAHVGQVVDALVVDVPSAGGDLVMHLFVVLSDGTRLDDELTAQIKRRIREDCSPRHVPDVVHQVAEVPRTLSGKVLEVPVKRILMGTPVERAASAGSLANPASLDYFVQLAAKI